MSTSQPESDPLALPFDQYQRYRLVADLLTRLRGGGPALEVLDVGGRTAVLRDFLPSERIRLVDMEASQSAGLVLGDGSALPFADKSFDVVAAFDTLEHVPPPRRDAFVAECARVARRWVVLCGPYQHERVEQAEELLQRFLKEKLGERHRFLDEHRHNGLPERGRVEAQFTSLGARVASIGHANLDRWLVLQCLSMYMDYDAVLRPLAREFQRFYNRSLYESDHAEPVYRHAVIAAFDGAALPTAEELLGPPRAPAGTLAPFLELAGELVAFDRDREGWRAERDVLRKQNADLRSDLDGHREVVAEMRREALDEANVIAELREILARERAGREETVATLERDLAGHRQKLAALERMISGEQQYAANFAHDRDSLAADLTGHRAALAAVSADLEGHRAALANANAELELVRAAHSSEKARADVLDGELRETLALATGLERSLADREVVYDQLKVELESRWRNFVRVFRPHR